MIGAAIENARHAEHATLGAMETAKRLESLAETVRDGLDAYGDHSEIPGEQFRYAIEGLAELARGAVERLGHVHNWLCELSSGARTPTGIAGPVKIKAKAPRAKRDAVKMAIVRCSGALIDPDARVQIGRVIEVKPQHVSAVSAVVEGAGGSIEVLP